MKKHSFFSVLTVFTVAASGCVAAPAPVSAPQTAPVLNTEMQPHFAATSERFLDSMGVCLHLGYGDTPYGNWPLMTEKLGELGIRHVRDGSNRYAGDSPPVWERFNELHERFGIKTTAVFSPAPFWDINTQVKGRKSVIDLLTLYPTAIAAVETPNETDIFRVHYEDKTFPEATRQYVTDLRRAMQIQPIAAKMPIIAPSVARAGSEERMAPLGDQIEFQNMHSYAGGGLPSDQLDSKWIPASNKIVGPGGLTKLLVATEAGYHTFAGNTDNAQPGVSEAAQGKYIPRLFAEYFNHGVQRTFIYQFIDGKLDPANSEANYGMLRFDGTPKPAFTALKNLISLVKNASAATQKAPLRALNFSMSSAPPDVHFTPLQNSDGSHLLLLWREIKSFDNDRKSPNYGKDIPTETAPVTLDFGPTLRAATLFMPNDGTEGRAIEVKQGRVSLDVSDKISVLRLESAPLKNPAQMPAAPLELTAKTTQNSANLSWKPVSGAAGYFVFRNLRPLGWTKTLEFADSSLASSLGFTYTVRAHDAAGFVGEAATVQAFTTEVPQPQLAGLPGSWCELENGAGHTNFKENPAASGGKYVAWFGFDKVVSVPVNVPTDWNTPQLFLRFARGAKTPTKLDVLLGPPEARYTKADDVKMLGTIDLPTTGSWISFAWTKTPLPALKAGKYRVFLRNSTPEGGELDVAGVVPDSNWTPPAHIENQVLKP